MPISRRIRHSRIDPHSYDEVKPVCAIVQVCQYIINMIKRDIFCISSELGKEFPSNVLGRVP